MVAIFSLITVTIDVGLLFLVCCTSGVVTTYLVGIYYV